MSNFQKKKVVFSSVIIAVIILLSVVLKTTGYYTVYTANTNRRQIPIYRVDGKEKEIAISFDCAWSDEYTLKILDALDFYNVKCTFFCVEFWVEKYPELVKEIVSRGHEIGTHSKTHPNMSKLNSDKIAEELSSSKKAIESITNIKVELFRAPFGDYDDRVIKTAKDMGLYTIQWDVDSLDWKDLSAQKIAERVIEKVKGGSIILCHNNGLHTLEALPLIFTALQKKGYEFQPISRLIYKENYTVLPNGSQKLND